MSVLVNFKICDNAKECGGILTCPTGALSWDEEKETININNEKCISCGICEKECPIGAIKVTKNDEQYEFAKKKIEEDERTIKDLFIDRYGAVAISDFFKINIDEIEEKVKKKGLSLIEIYNPDEAECLLKSIPIKTLTKDLPNETVFYKAEYEKCINDKYKINDFPCILVFQNGYLLGIIEGYFTIDEKEIVLSKLNDILTKENSKR